MLNLLMFYNTGLLIAIIWELIDIFVINKDTYAKAGWKEKHYVYSFLACISLSWVGIVFNIFYYFKNNRIKGTVKEAEDMKNSVDALEKIIKSMNKK